jgi:hypothetical protein
MTLVTLTQHTRIDLHLVRPLQKCIFNKSRCLTNLEITFWRRFCLESFYNHLHLKFHVRLFLNYYFSFRGWTSPFCFVFILALSQSCCNLFLNFTLSFPEPLHQLGQLLIGHNLSNPSTKLANTRNLPFTRWFWFNECIKSLRLPVTWNCNLVDHCTRSYFFLLDFIIFFNWFSLNKNGLYLWI